MITQHGSNTTRQHYNMVVAQNMVQTLLGTDNSTKGKKAETTIHHTKQPQLSVRVSMIESLNEVQAHCRFRQRSSMSKDIGR